MEAMALLSTVRDPAAILRRLIERGAPVYAGRLAGAFRHIGYGDFADRIMRAMRSSGYEVGENDPFQERTPVLRRERVRSPYVARLRLMWAAMRDAVAASFEAPPGLPRDHRQYLDRVRALSTLDAYHSLSIEGYRLSRELIEKVRANAFDPKRVAEDREAESALAARGYYDASIAVTASIEQILEGSDPADVVRRDHHEWYQAMYAVAVQAGMHRAGDLAGYRNHQAYINGSNHMPLPTDAVVDAMECLFDLIGGEPHPAVRAVLGHFIFVFVHPYGDGNGRMARFLMNTLFASGGYPWTVVHLDVRDRYMQALERASTEGRIDRFAGLIAEEMARTEKEQP